MLTDIALPAPGRPMRATHFRNFAEAADRARLFQMDGSSQSNRDRPRGFGEGSFRVQCAGDRTLTFVARGALEFPPNALTQHAPPRLSLELWMRAASHTLRLEGMATKATQAELHLGSWLRGDAFEAWTIEVESAYFVRHSETPVAPLHAAKHVPTAG